MFQFVAILVLLVAAVLSYCTNWHPRWRLRHILGPKPTFPLGNAQTVRSKGSFRAYADWQAQYGDIFKIFFVQEPIIVISDPDLVRQVTVKEFNKFHDRFIPNLTSKRTLFTGRRLEAAQAGMIAAQGSYWGSIRAGAQPMFHTKHLSTYADTINQALDDFAVNLDRFAESGQQVDMHRQLGRVTMQVIGNAAFGVDFQTQNVENVDIELVQAAKEFFDNGAPSFWDLVALLLPTIFLPLVRVLAKKFPSKAGLKTKKAFETLYDASDNLIENSRKEYNSNSEKPAPWKWFRGNPNNPYKDTVPTENSVISMLMKAKNKATGKPFAPLHVAAQTFTMMLAGYETTANTLAYSVYLLGKHPDAQRRLLQEMDQHPGRPGYDSLHQFPYAAAVINEALRLYPPATQLSRVASEDVQLGVHWIPKGTGVHVALWAMQHDERWWQDAEAFKPERWLGDKTGGDRSDGLAYMPFGVGPRMCIGIKLALEEAIIALVRLNQDYTFQLSDKLLSASLEVKQSVTMSPKGGVPVTVQRRSCSAESTGAAAAI